MDPFGHERVTVKELFLLLKHWMLQPRENPRAHKFSNQDETSDDFVDTHSVEEFTRCWNERFKQEKRARSQANNPRPVRREISRLRSTIQYTVSVMVAAIPISFYIVQPSNLSNAIAANNDEETINRHVSQQQKSSTKNQRHVIRRNADTADHQVKAIKRNPAQQFAETNRQPSESVRDVMNETALEHAKKHSDPKYVCPMHPDVISDDPNAICPICGMDLVQLERGDNNGLVKLTPKVINALGVRTAKVKRRTLYRRIDSVGYVSADENSVRAVSLRTDGWLERMAVKSEGERVNKGQLLFELYSPALINAQEEFLQAMQHKNELLLKASRERLRALGVSDDQVKLLEMTKEVEQLVQVYAPQSGIVSDLHVREGMYVKPSQPVINLVDLNSVWLMVDIFERQADWVEVGQRAQATLPFMPGKSWEGMVEYVYPSLDATSRSLKVRLHFDNLEEELKPNMYADVTIYAQPKRKVLVIPKEALIVTGSQKRVIVALGKGRFIPMSVGVGMETDDKVEITSGLGEGDEVVTSSQFLIDSESSLKASLARMADSDS